ncbi:MAG TPA: peptidoglycan DD-metalloendopeptidase family protein [Thermoanaerobaculia bacterium]|nr:peptidoglycan DD-metalloendopeptidase family protein [Thermoanaerobaculia bacterium]
MKKVLALLGIAIIGLVAWLAAGTDEVTDAPGANVPVAMGAPPSVATSTSASAPLPAGEPMDTPPPDALNEPAVPIEVISPIATETAPALSQRQTTPTQTIPSMHDSVDEPRPMIVPVAGIARSAVRDMFNDVRGNRRHEAIDIMAPHGTPVIATDDGVVKKLFTSKPGGLTVYQFDPDQRFCYYYAHLDRYAAGLHEGQLLRRGEVLGYVGVTGNAPKNAPHLHFALIRLDLEKRWWKGTYVNPYPYLAGQ